MVAAAAAAAAAAATASSSLARKVELLRHPDLSQCLAAFPALPDLHRTHALIVTSGLSSDPFTFSRFLACFCCRSSSSSSSSSSADLRHTKSLFFSFNRPTLFMYNTMIRAFSWSLDPVESVRFYVRMLRARISPDRHTFPFLIRACSALGLKVLGRGIHCHVAKLGLDSDVYVVNNGISLYSGWGDMSSAQQLFDEQREVVDVVSWTALVTGYANCRQLDRARWFFDQMPTRNSISWNSMVAGYAQSGRVRDALQLFEQMPERNLDSWSSIISGFAQAGRCKQAFDLFKEMLETEIVPNEQTLVSALSACAQLRDSEKGEWVHRYIQEHNIEVGVILGTVLVQMYGKCGSISKALDIFKQLPEKNLYSWNSMIAGLAMNGSPLQALTLLWKMLLQGLEPNAITFIGVLSACSHSGLVDEGRRFFDMMTRVYRIRPMEEHYGCMVDLLGRAGLIKEALDFVQRMPVEPHPGLWGALAGACRMHGDVELGERIGKRLIEMEPHHGGRYVFLASIYGDGSRWNDMAEMRKLLRHNKARKAPGNSLVGAPCPFAAAAQ